MSKMSERAIQTTIKVPPTLVHTTRDGINDLFAKYQAQISQVLPKHLTAVKVIQLATSIVSRSPKLKECSTASIIGGVMNAAMLGLDLTPQLGQCFLVPFKDKKGQSQAEFMIGYKGQLLLMRQTGDVETVYAYVVRENDHFEYEYGLEPRLMHKPDITSNRGQMVYAYAVAKFISGGFLFEVLDKKTVLDAKAKSKAGNSQYSPWNGTEADQEMMWRKTAIRKMTNFMPLSIESASRLASDGQVIRPEMFDSKDKALDVSLIEDEPDFEKLRAEKKQEDGWLAEMNGFKEKLIQKSDRQNFLNLLGQAGYESLDEVPEKERENVKELIIQGMNNLSKAS